LLSCQLVRFGGTNSGLHYAFQDIAIKLSGSAFSLGVNVLGHKPVGQLGHRGHTPFGGLLSGRINPVRHRTQDRLGARPSALWSDFVNCGDRIAPDRRTAP